MEENILVTTEQLIQKKQELSNLIEKAEGTFLEAAEAAELLECHLYGSPASILKRKFSAKRKEGERVFRDFKAHLNKLEEIALVYDRAERKNHGLLKTD